MQPPAKRRRRTMEGLTVAVSPKFVSNVLVLAPPNQLGEEEKVPKLVSLLDPDNGQAAVLKSGLDDRYDLLLKTDRRFVSAIEYPTLEEAAASPGAIWGQQQQSEKGDDSLVTSKLINMTSYAQEGEGDSEGEQPFESEEEEEEDFEQERELQFLHLQDGAQMSFDDLGQIYTNISRKRILSKVQCPNIHFHAHSDGSTTVHRHKSCKKVDDDEEGDVGDGNNNADKERKTSHESVDMESVMVRMKAARREEEQRQQRLYQQQMQMHQQVPLRGQQHHPAEIMAMKGQQLMLSRQNSGLSTFSKHVENERYKGTLGRIHQQQLLQHTYSNKSTYIGGNDDDASSPAEEEEEEDISFNEPLSDVTSYVSMAFNNNNYSHGKMDTMNPKIPVSMLHCENEVCEVGGGVKVNPFYIREMRQNHQDNKSGNPNAYKKTSVDSNASASSAKKKQQQQHAVHGELCEALLDAVVRCAGAAETHAASSAACAQCADFARRFRRGLAKVVEAEAAHGPPFKPFPLSRQGSADVEMGLAGHHGHRMHSRQGFHAGQAHPGQQQLVYLPHHPSCNSLRSSNRPKLIVHDDNKVKVMAYVSVIVLSVLLLVIVVIFLTLFFTQHPAMVAMKNAKEDGNF